MEESLKFIMNLLKIKKGVDYNLLFLGYHGIQFCWWFVKSLLGAFIMTRRMPALIDWMF